MKKSRFTDSQIIDALKRTEAGLAVPELCRELGIRSATFCKWRSKSGLSTAFLFRRKTMQLASRFAHHPPPPALPDPRAQRGAARAHQTHELLLCSGCGRSPQAALLTHALHEAVIGLGEQPP